LLNFWYPVVIAGEAFQQTRERQGLPQPRFLVVPG